jgi:uncharacterized membrane protein
MDEPEALSDRVAALEHELAQISRSLAVLQAWASRYGVNFEAGAAAATTSVPAAASAARAGATPRVSAATTPGTSAPALSADQIVIRVMYGVGLLVLLVGGAIFLPNIRFIEPHARTLVGIVVGLAAIVAGARRPVRTWQADGILALGASLEYLTLWYAHSAQLASAPVCALAMFAVTALLGALSYVHRSERLAFAGLLGGYITPLLVASESPDFFSLNAYLLVLGAFALTLAVARGFRYVEAAVFAAVALYATQWSTRFDDTWRPLNALAAATLYFFEFGAAILAAARRGETGLARQVLLSISLLGFAFFLAIELANVNVDDAVFRGALLALAIVCIVAARVPAVAAQMRPVYAWWGVGAVALALQGIVDSAPISGAFAVEGAVLAGIAARSGSNAARFASGVAFVFAFGCAGSQIIIGSRSDANFFNATFVTFGGIALAFAAAVEFERRAGQANTTWLAVIRSALHAVAVFVLANQAYTILPSGARAELAATAVLTLYAIALIAAGVRLGRGLLRALGAILFLIVVGKIFLVDLSGVDEFVRFLSFLGVGAALVGAALWYQRGLARSARDTSKGTS